MCQAPSTKTATAPPSPTSSSSSCTERFGDAVDHAISGFFYKVGSGVGKRPIVTIVLCFLLTAACGIGYLTWHTENRPEELWLPQNTEAHREEEQYLEYFPRNARLSQLIISSSEEGQNVLTKESLVQAIKLHLEVERKQAVIPTNQQGNDSSYDFLDLCVPAGLSCATEFPLPGSTRSVCNCLITSILKQWNYNLTVLEQDDNVLASVNAWGSRRDLETVLGKAVFDEDDNLQSAEALAINYFLVDRAVEENGDRLDPVNEGWEEQVFLATAAAWASTSSSLTVDYFAQRSLLDEFGGAIESDIFLIQIAYFLAFGFLGATLGRVKCGTGSRWILSTSALVTVSLSSLASLGLASAFGLFWGPGQVGGRAAVVEQEIDGACHGSPFKWRALAAGFQNFSIHGRRSSSWVQASRGCWCSIQYWSAIWSGFRMPS